MVKQEIPEVEVRTDYDGYFCHLVESWLREKGSGFKHKRYVVSAGPYRSSAVTLCYLTKGGELVDIGAENPSEDDPYWIMKDTLYLDFYSALRRGFGGLSYEDVRQIKELL